MKLLTANLCMMSEGGCVKLSVMLALGGVFIATAMLACSSWLRFLVLKMPYPGAIGFLLYFMFGMRATCVLLGTFRIFCAGMLPYLVGNFYVKTIGEVILGAFSGLGFVFAAFGPMAHVLTFVLRQVAPKVVHDAQTYRLLQFMAMLPGHDIVCLQELTVTWGQDEMVTKIKDFASSCGLKHFASSGKWPVLPALMCSSGLVILSKYNIKKTEYYPFSRQAWFEWSAIARGALMVILDGPKNKKIAVLNIHTTAGLEVIQTGMGLTKRFGSGGEGEATTNPTGYKQLLEALGKFEEFSKGADQRIFCGDFNLSKDSDSFASFRARALEKMKLTDQYADSPPTFACVDADGNPKERLLTKHTSDNLPRAIDHVFSDVKCKSAKVDDMAAKKDDAERYGYQQVSDHSAIVMEWA
mmetsp:Transcript_35557/g.82107  ORF Transcript_35557/g.82107 Transcript_35557/m.82107 type:complete len:412 (-) Transcript_35557:55-1290(-)